MFLRMSSPTYKFSSLYHSQVIDNIYGGGARLYIKTYRWECMYLNTFQILQVIEQSMFLFLFMAPAYSAKYLHLLWCPEPNSREYRCCRLTKLSAGVVEQKNIIWWAQLIGPVSYVWMSWHLLVRQQPVKMWREQWTPKVSSIGPTEDGDAARGTCFPAKTRKTNLI